MIDLDKFNNVMNMMKKLEDYDLEISMNACQGVRYYLIQNKDTEECYTSMFADIDGLVHILTKLTEAK